MMPEQNRPADNMVAQRFGWLIVDLPSSRRTTAGGAYWWCICRCGNRVEAIGHNLRSGNTVSCGCLRMLLPAARRLLVEYRTEAPKWQSSQQQYDWTHLHSRTPRDKLILSLMFGHLLAGQPLGKMTFPLRKNAGGSRPTAIVRGKKIRRGRDSTSADILFDGPDAYEEWTR